MYFLIKECVDRLTMKYFAPILFTVLFCLKVTAQKQNSVTNNEVVFVLYEDYQNLQTKRETSSRSLRKDKMHFMYFFYFNKVDNIQLNFREFKDFDEKENDNPDLFFKVKKSFIRKNKNIILSKKKMLTLGYKKVFNLLNNAKYILLIDKTECDDRLIPVKEVYLNYIGEE